MAEATMGSAGADTDTLSRSTRPLVALLPRVEMRASGKSKGMVSQLCLIQAIQRAGGTPVILTPTEDPAELARYVQAFDAFVVPGGGDIEPSYYGQERLPECGAVDEGGRDEFELAIIPLIVAADKPLLGICRGNQALNVALGGTLWQDLPSQCGTSPEPKGEGAPDPRELARKGHIAHSQGAFEGQTHEVRVVEGTLLERITAGAGEFAEGLVSRDGACEAAVTKTHDPVCTPTPVVGKTEQGTAAEAGAAHACNATTEHPTLVNNPADAAHLMVNSFHHQAVREVAPHLIANAYAPDGTIEGIEMPGKRFVLSVQWHPETIWEYDPAAYAIFQALVDEAARK